MSRDQLQTLDVRLQSLESRAKAELTNLDHGRQEITKIANRFKRKLDTNVPMALVTNRGRGR